MSSPGTAAATASTSLKKRRLQNACDICRRQKIRCDSSKMPGNRCSNCIAFGSECTHNLSQLKEKKVNRRKRTTDPQSDQLVAEESKLVSKNVKEVVDGLLSGTHAAPQDRETLLQLLFQVSRFAKDLQGELDTCRQSHSPSSGSSAVSPRFSDLDPAEEFGTVIDIRNLPERVQRITADAANHRYFGKNSSMMMVQTAIETKGKHTNTLAPRLTRPQFWASHPWEVASEAPAVLHFPPADLLSHLVDIYFTQQNIYFPILHRMTFEESISDGLHLRDHRFGATVLAVCALASKNSPDKRVLSSDGPNAEFSAGWKWFQQIRSPFGYTGISTLYDLQLCCLYLAFQQSGSKLESAWLLAGIGILHIEDIGAHIGLDPGPSRESEKQTELTRRTCYNLFAFDTIVSACFGRPRVSSVTRSELPLPVACDDEYWDHPDPEKAFKQPPGKPSLIDYYIAYIKLIKTFTFAWREVEVIVSDYTGRKPLEPEVVAELDSRLNQWAEEIPEHLKWNPYMKDDVFFDQSASLYAAYFHIQVLVHRPFIRTREDQPSSSSTFRSLVVCTNAARSCSHVLDVKSRRGFFPNAHTIKAAFDSAIVLILMISGGTRSGLDIDVQRELIDVYKCMGLLRRCEQRWQNAGRFYDIICELMAAYNIPLPAFPPCDLPAGQWSANDVHPRTAGNDERKSASGAEEEGVLNPDSWPDYFAPLPMAAEDLGRLPLYGSLDFSDSNILDQLIPDSIPPGSNAPDVGDLLPESMIIDDPYLNSYMSYWIPYVSSVDGMVQAMNSGLSGN